MTDYQVWMRSHVAAAILCRDEYLERLERYFATAVTFGRGRRDN